MPPKVFIAGRYGLKGVSACRAAYGGGVHPGWVAEGCNIGWSGKQVVVPTFEWLVNMPATASWLRVATIPQLAKNAFYGGREAGGAALAVCRGYYDVPGGKNFGYILPGKVNLRRSTNEVICNVGLQGVEMTLNVLDVLVLP